MSTRDLKHDLGSMMIRITISVTIFLVLLVAPAGALQGQADALHDGARVTAAFDHQLDALNKKLAEILVRPLPTTNELLSSTLYGTVDRRTNFPRGVNLLPEWLMRSRTIPEADGILLVALAAALQDQTDATLDGPFGTAAFDYRPDALNEKLAEILVPPLPTTADLLSSAVYGTMGDLRAPSMTWFRIPLRRVATSDSNRKGGRQAGRPWLSRRWSEPYQVVDLDGQPPVGQLGEPIEDVGVPGLGVDDEELILPIWKRVPYWHMPYRDVFTVDRLSEILPVCLSQGRAS